MLTLEAELDRGALSLDIALEVHSGSCLVLAGPSGAGKTSALRVAAGLLAPDRGRVACGDEVWLDTAAGLAVAPEARRCGYLFQDYALFPHLSAWRNVAYGLRELRRRERRARAHELLDRFGMEGHAEARPSTLSGGERQRVALARALSRRPKALLLDEPLSALDARTRSRAAHELGSLLRAAGVPVLLVTHDFGEAVALGDRVGVIDGGRIVQEGTPAELAARPVSAFVADFSGAVVLLGVARQGPDGLTMVDLDGGGTVASTASARGRVAASVFPWEIALEPPAGTGITSQQNRLTATVASVTELGNRVRVGLNASQSLTADVSGASVRELGLRPGARVVASWKAAATRLAPV